MALDSAIQNVGEYYAAHYLAERFQNDIQDQVRLWCERGSQATPRRLQGLADTYFRAKTRALDFPEPALRAHAECPELHAWHGQLLNALGYTPEPLLLELESERQSLPVTLRLHRYDRPWLAVLEAPFCLSGGGLNEEPLEQQPIPNGKRLEGWPILQTPWGRAITILFKQEDRPRWLLLLAGSRVYLFDAHTYAQGRYLSINWDDAFARKKSRTFEAIAALLARDPLAPEAESEQVLHERLREGSLKSTHGVSEKLQGAVRQSIELIANGWVHARRAKNLGYRNLSEQEAPLPDGSRVITAERLKHEALVTVYRILFCLYAEARGGELGLLPIDDDVYRLGYSIEALRDLADRGEPGTLSENGSYYTEHLARLFQLIHKGFQPQAGIVDAPGNGAMTEQPDLFDGISKTFAIKPLTATLFDPIAAPLMNRVKLSNRVLHRVIRCLSLGTGQKGKQIGRINYAELGIVQLGSVYEGLLSYRGCFAKEDLIQVLQAPNKQNKQQPVVYDDAIDSKTPTWFVPKSRLEEFKPGEVIIERRSQQPRIYKTGEFILHLNGVDRVNSASYYTPVVLTRSLVKEALKERLKAFGPQQADDILKLTLCEPAMGSAAFLVEAIDQLAHTYLRLKQEQIGKAIEPSDYEDEHRRVKHYIAVHNVYGVDLNPTAVELGALSLWLASIHRLKETTRQDQPERHQPSATPWFGLRLRAGNSLIGARRAVWTQRQLSSGRFYGNRAEAPRQLKPGEARKPGEIYHFLVWDEDMAPAAKDRLMRSHWPEHCRAINDWQRIQVRKNWTAQQLAVASTLCERIDTLWAEYAAERIAGLKNTECTASVWPQPVDFSAFKSGPTLRQQEDIKRRLEAESGAFQRLKLLMDSWCSFYFWPLEQAQNLPSRDGWLVTAQVLLDVKLDNEQTPAQLDAVVGEAIGIKTLLDESRQQLPDAETLSRTVPWYGVARQVNSRQHFHHWELVFTEILGPEFEGQGTTPQGFDLMFGNPPWVGTDWKEAPVLSEYEPLLGVRDARSEDFKRALPKLLEAPKVLENFRDLFVANEGVGTFLNDITLYPALKGMRTNLYKNFVERSWGLLGKGGIAGLLHPEGVFDDPRGGKLRSSYYPRLRCHFQFRNELELFSEVHHQHTFSINIYGAEKQELLFTNISNLYHPKTIDDSGNHRALSEPVPGMKNENGHWELRGHALRRVFISDAELRLFAKLFEDEGTPHLEARLPQLHSQPLLKVLEKFAQAPKRLGDLKGEYLATDMFNEANAKRDGIITREENPSFQPRFTDEWVVSGPHFYVGTPFNKTPRSSCTANGHYDDIDLTEIPEDYLPRAVYRPGDRKGDLSAFYKAIPEWPKPTRPGFWPVSDEEVPAYEMLLGEPLKRYGIDPNLPGAKTARKFGYFTQWEGPVEEAVRWLVENGGESGSKAFNNKYSSVRITQNDSCSKELNGLPRPYTTYYRYANREMAQPANERSLIPCILPFGACHLYTAFSLAFADEYKSLLFFGANISILNDFVIKLSGRGHCRHDLLRRLPVQYGALEPFIVSRALRLIAVSSMYKELWYRNWNESYTSDDFVINGKSNLELESDWSKLTHEWVVENALRSAMARRWAQVEIDVLVALALNLTLDELIQIYTVQFPVMKAYEEADQYDAKGRRLPNTIRKDPGARELREALKSHDGDSPVTASWKIDNGNRTVTKTFYPPFTHVDRIEDYRVAYRVFKERLGLDKE
jgi:hypothetical protein